MNRKNVTHILMAMLLIASIIAPAVAQTKKPTPAPPKSDKTAPAADAIADRYARTKISADIRASEIPWYGKIRYPKDWKERSIRRERYGAGVAAESEENRQIRMKLRKKLAKVPLTGIEFKSAVDYLREVSGLNILVNWGALKMESEEIQVREINVMLNDVTVEQALQAILEDAGGGVVQIGYVVQDGIVTISTMDRIRAVVTLEVYDVRDLIDWTEPKEMDRFMEMLTSSVDRETWYPNGHASINDTNGLLVIRNTPPNHEEIRKLLGKLRAIPAAGEKRPISRRTRAKETRMQIKLVGDMKETCFDPNAMGLIALGAISQEIPRPPQEVIEELEALLDKTETLGLRNAIYLTLKDLYKQTNQPEKTLELMRSMFVENDKTPLWYRPAEKRGESRVEVEK